MNEKEELSDNEKDISRQFNLIPQEKVDKEITDVDTAFQRIEILEDKVKKMSEEDIKRIDELWNKAYEDL